MRGFLPSCFLIAALTFFALSCGQRRDPQLLAKVGSSEIRLERFQQQMIRRGGAKPELLDKAALLDEMIEFEALYVKALQLGLDRDPEVQQAYRNLLVAKLKERELASRIDQVDVTADEIQARYEADRERYTRPARVRLAVLCLKTAPTMSAEKVAALRQRLTEARAQAVQSSDPQTRGFGPLAIEYSEDQATRYKGGEVGWIEANRGHAWLSQTVISNAFALKAVGDVSEVLTDPQGVYLVKLLERRDAERIPLKEVEASLRQKLRQDKRQALERAFVQEARRSVPVVTYPDLLARVASPVPKTPTEGRQPPAFP